MMEPNDLPPEPGSADALVVRLIDEIDESSDELRDTLLRDLLCAAWGSAVGQNQ
jgi:hypothetical protein